MAIRNTAKADPLIQAATAFAPGGVGIYAQEAAGQAELCAAGRKAQLPKDGLDDAEKLGIKVIGPSEGDELFVDVELPEGWSIVPTDHSMHSSLIDEKGRKRAGIFYKAAFYDRSASISFCRRYSAFYRPFGGWETTDRKAPRVGVARDSDGNEIWVSEPLAHETFIGNRATSLAVVWLDEHYPNWKDLTAYWD